MPAFDTVPGQAAASKQRIFDLAAREEALVFTHHFPPFPNVGWVTKTETGWRWHPMTESKNSPLEGAGEDLRMNAS